MSFSCFDNSNYDYNALVNKPCVNGCILSGDMSFEDMGLTELVQQYTLQYAEECIYPTVDNCLATKQDCLTPGLGICLCSDNTIQVAGDTTLDTASENVIKNCTVTNAVCSIYDCICCALNTKQDKLCEGRAICITGNCIAVKVDNSMDNTSTNPVANCAVNQAIDRIMSCGYQAGNSIEMTTDQYGCHVISLADCVNVVCDLFVAGCTSLNGTLTVFGDIYQCGSTYCAHAEEVYSCCDCIYLRDGATSPLAIGDKSGFVALKYNGTANAILAVDSTGTWRLGETDGDPNQVIATRAETCNTENNALAVWNCACQCFDTTHSSDNQILTWDNICVESLQNSLNSNHTKLKGEITNADTITMHDYDSFAKLETDIQKQDREFSRYDNVAGVACTFCMTNIFKYTQCGCCVDYSTLCEGPISCAKECLRIEIPLNGDVPTVTGTTACPDAATKYAYDFYDNANTNIVSLYSQEDELYNELECYVVKDVQCTVMLKKQYCYIPNKTGSMLNGCYSANNLTSDPSYCNLCTAQLCYTLDDLGIFCNACTYYCYDSVSLGYCCIAMNESSYIPATYYFQHEDHYTQTSCFDLVYNCDTSTCAVCGDCFIQPSTNCQSVCDFRIYRSLTLGQATVSCCYNATCTEVTYTCCYPITAINTCVYENNYRLQIEESGNGRDYLVHSYGLPGNYLEQCRTYKGKSAIRQCCNTLNGGTWTNWTDITRTFISINSTNINGVFASNNMLMSVMFTSNIVGTDTVTPLTITYNGDVIPVKISKEGTLISITAKEISKGTYRYIDAFTTLDFVYLEDAEGNGPAFVIIGNPIVLSSTDYTIYANGQIIYADENKLSDWYNFFAYSDKDFIGIRTTIINSAPYDGFVIANSITGIGYGIDIAINNIVVIAQYAEHRARSAVIAPFRKGDKIQIGKAYDNYDDNACLIAFYENRNYTNR